MAVHYLNGHVGAVVGAGYQGYSSCRTNKIHRSKVFHHVLPVHWLAIGLDSLDRVSDGKYVIVAERTVKKGLGVRVDRMAQALGRRYAVSLEEVSPTEVTG